MKFNLNLRTTIYQQTKIKPRLQFLLKKIKTGDKRFDVYPYCAPVRRYTRCQGLKRSVKYCRAKDERCCRGTKISHTRGSCNQEALCIECGGKHSAAFHGGKAKVLKWHTRLKPRST